VLPSDQSWLSRSERFPASFITIPNIDDCQLLCRIFSHEKSKSFSTRTMPRGYLKHNKQAGRKKARGGSSKQRGRNSAKPEAWRSRNNKLTKCIGAAKDDTTVTSTFPEAEDDFAATNALPQAVTAKRQPMLYAVAECAICLETKPVISLSKHCQWHDSACYACLRRVYVTDAHRNPDKKKFPLCCFHPLCQNPVHLAQLQKHKLICSPAEIKKHHERLLLSKASTMKDPLTVYCPHCDFPRVLKKLGKNDQTRACRSCQCPYLVSPDYCTIRTLERLQNDAKGENNGWVRCPGQGCGVLISLGDGGSDMECACCGCYFNFDVIVDKRPLLARPHDNDIYLWW